MGFAELRDNLFEVLAGGEFTMDFFPHVRMDSLRGRYSFQARFHASSNFRITIGGNISSTAFNQAYIDELPADRLLACLGLVSSGAALHVAIARALAMEPRHHAVR